MHIARNYNGYVYIPYIGRGKPYESLTKALKKAMG